MEQNCLLLFPLTHHVCNGCLFSFICSGPGYYFMSTLNHGSFSVTVTSYPPSIRDTLFPVRIAIADCSLITRGYFVVSDLRKPHFCSQLRMIKVGDIGECQCCGRNFHGCQCRSCRLMVRVACLNSYIVHFERLWTLYLPGLFVSFGGTMGSFSNCDVGS